MESGEEFAAERDFDGLVVVSKKATSSEIAAQELEGAFETVRLIATRRGGSMEGACLLLAAPSNGVFGALATGRDGELAAGYSGIAKSLAKEWPEARSLAVDIDDRKAEHLAKDLLDEFESRGPAEIAWHAGKRLTLQRVESLNMISDELHGH